MDRTGCRLPGPAAWALLGLLLVAPAGCRHYDDGWRGPDRPPQPYYEGNVRRDPPPPPPGYSGGEAKRVYRGKIEVPDDRRANPPRLDPNRRPPAPPQAQAPNRPAPPKTPPQNRPVPPTRNPQNPPTPAKAPNGQPPPPDRPGAPNPNR